MDNSGANRALMRTSVLFLQEKDRYICHGLVKKVYNETLLIGIEEARVLVQRVLQQNFIENELQE